MSDNQQKNQPDRQSILEQVQQEVAQGFVQWPRALKRTEILIVAYLVLFVLFLILAWFVHIHPILSIDIAITQEFQEHQLPWLKWFMLVVSFLGSQFLLFSSLILLTAVLFWLIQLHLEALFIAGLSIISAALNELLKYIVGRPRPTSNLVEIFQNATGKSFPSGHVMSYMAYWGLLFSFGLILLKRDRWWHYLLLVIPGLFVLLVGPSRIYLGDHWASDVLGAYMFGGLLLGITLSLYLALKGKGILQQNNRKAY